MSISNSPSTSRVQSPQTTQKIPTSFSPNLVRRMQQSTCHNCKQRGHWSWFCPSKSPKTKPFSPSPNQDSTVSHKRAHGSEDEFVNSNRQSRQRTLHEFWKGSQSQNVKGESSQAQIKSDGFPELEISDNDIEFMNSVSWDTIEAKAILSLSQQSRPSRILSPQVMLQRRIFSDDSFADMDKDKSMENSLTMEEHNKLLEDEKVMRHSQLKDEYFKTEAWLEESNKRKQLLCEEVSKLSILLDEKQKQLKCFELESLKMETRLSDLKRRILETEIIALKESVDQTQVVRKQSEETQAKQSALKTSVYRSLNFN